MTLYGPDSIWIWTALQAISVTVTLVLILLQLRTQAATHVVGSLNMLVSRWTSSGMLLARQRVSQSFLDGELEFYDSAEVIAEFFEEIGVYRKIRAIPDKVLWEAFSWYIEYYYSMLEFGVLDSRKKHKDESIYSNFINLNTRMRAISKVKLCPTHLITDVELREFALSESHYAKTALFLETKQPSKEAEQNGSNQTPASPQSEQLGATEERDSKSP